MVGIVFGDGKPGGFDGSLPPGGNLGDVLFKNSSNPFDTSWKPQLTPITISSGTANLNDYTTPGIYYFPWSTSYVNTPNSAGNGFLMVFADDSKSYVKQIFYRVGSNPNTHKDMYERLFGSGAWGSWSEIAHYSTPSITLNTVSGFTFSNFACRKRNGWVFLEIQVETTATPTNASVTVCTLPAGYRPDFAVHGRSPGQSGGHYYNFDVNTTGTFTVSRNPTQVAAKTGSFVSFPVPD